MPHAARCISCYWLKQRSQIYMLINIYMILLYDTIIQWLNTIQFSRNIGEHLLKHDLVPKGDATIVKQLQLAVVS